MRYKSHKYKFDLTELKPYGYYNEKFIREILGWLYTNLPLSHFRYNHCELVVRFQHKEDRMAFKLVAFKLAWC